MVCLQSFLYSYFITQLGYNKEKDRRVIFMNGKTHLSIGLAIGAVMGAEYFKRTGEPVGVLVLVVNSAVGSVLPDIDLETSYIGCRIPILPKFINRVFGHRGFTHSILCMVCCSFLL